MRILVLLLLALVAAPALGQNFDDAVLATPLPRGEGLAGFTDTEFILKTLFNLTLAAVLGGTQSLHTNSFDEALATLQAFLDSAEGLPSVRRFVRAAADTLERGGRLFACGNGGSMCDAMHFAEEWTGRFRKVFLNERGQVIGAILIGETNDAGMYYKWIRTRTPFPGESVLRRTNTYAGFLHRMT